MSDTYRFPPIGEGGGPFVLMKAYEDDARAVAQVREPPCTALAAARTGDNGEETASRSKLLPICFTEGNFLRQN